jgi:hypothetical protein
LFVVKELNPSRVCRKCNSVPMCNIAQIIKLENMTQVANKKGEVKSSTVENSDVLKRTVNAEAQTEKLIKGTGKGTSKGKAVATAKKTDKPAAKKEKKECAESNVHIGERLLKEKANAATILATFTKVYKDKKDITDKKFVQARANIYMAIATKKAELQKVTKKAKAA